MKIWKPKEYYFEDFLRCYGVVLFTTMRTGCTHVSDPDTFNILNQHRELFFILHTQKIKQVCLC